MGDTKGANHVREHGSVLARVEKQALIWMAKRLPSWINSDHLTALGLLAMIVAGGAYWASAWSEATLLVVVGGLAVNWFGDSLDGTVARVRKQQRPNYGFYVDHVIDIMSALFLFGGLGLSPYMSPLVALPHDLCRSVSCDPRARHLPRLNAQGRANRAPYPPRRGHAVSLSHTVGRAGWEPLPALRRRRHRCDRWHVRGAPAFHRAQHPRALSRRAHSSVTHATEPENIDSNGYDLQRHGHFVTLAYLHLRGRHGFGSPARRAGHADGGP